MSFTLDHNKSSNNITLNVTLPDDALDHTVLLDFISEYDREDYHRSLSVTSQGPWLTGTLPNDRVPPTDQYRVEVHATLQDHLALRDIHIPLSQIMVPLRDIVGPTRDALLATLQALVIGNDYPTTEERITAIPTAVERTGTSTTVRERISSNENARGTTRR